MRDEKYVMKMKKKIDTDIDPIMTLTLGQLTSTCLCSTEGNQETTVF